MSQEHPGAILARILRAENEALAAGDVPRAMTLLTDKRRAADALTGALPSHPLSIGMARTLRDLTEENGERLRTAMTVQSNVLALVARAARLAASPPARYGARGGPTTSIGAMALQLRA